jgi:K+-transporting ATPase KdpF subunit
MTIADFAGLACAVVVLAYLTYTLLRPERF